MKITPREKRRHFSLSRPLLAFLAGGNFHARSRFARSTIPEEKKGTTARAYVLFFAKWPDRRKLFLPYFILQFTLVVILRRFPVLNLY